MKPVDTWFFRCLFVLGVAALSGCGGASASAPAGPPPPAIPAETAPRDIIPFTEGMTPPKRLSGENPVYTRAAYQACVAGWSTVRCVVTTAGDVRDCRVTQSVPHMDAAVLGALATWRMAPALRDGKPVNVDYEFKGWVGPPGLAPSPDSAAAPASAPPPAAQETSAPPVITPFDGKRMTRPKMLCGRDPVYTKEALEEGVSGLAIVRCTISAEGAVTNCRVIKALPHMMGAILDGLKSRRYTPATLDGAPINVDYVFNIKLVLPIR